jgi:hypothetical protein
LELGAVGETPSTIDVVFHSILFTPLAKSDIDLACTKTIFAYQAL